jgi:hypothetical protein
MRNVEITAAAVVSAASARSLALNELHIWNIFVRCGIDRLIQMSTVADQADHLHQQLEQLRTKKALITSPLDDEIEKLTQKLVALKPDEAAPGSDVLSTHHEEPTSFDAVVAACASDNSNAFARAGRLLFKSNIKLSSVRSDRKLSLLHTCARFGSVKVLNQLLDSEPVMLSFLDDFGRDALIVSVLYRQLHVFHILSRFKDCSYAHQSLPFLNNCLHDIARFGLVSFSREILSTNRGNDPRIQLAMSQCNKDGLQPLHVMAARLDVEMITQAFAVNSQWLDQSTATGMNVFDVAIASEDAMQYPRLCFSFICSVALMHPPAREQFLLAGSNRYKHSGALLRCDGALLAFVRSSAIRPLFLAHTLTVTSNTQFFSTAFLIHRIHV